MRVPVKGRHKYVVYGEYGGEFTNYEDAMRCAREASKTPEHNYRAEIWIEDLGTWYDMYDHGKLIAG